MNLPKVREDFLREWLNFSDKFGRDDFSMLYFFAILCDRNFTGVLWCYFARSIDPEIVPMLEQKSPGIEQEKALEIRNAIAEFRMNHVADLINTNKDRDAIMQGFRGIFDRIKEDIKRIVEID